MRSTPARGISSAEPLRPVVLWANDAVGSWGELEPFIQKSVDKSQGMISVARIREMVERREASVFATLCDNRYVAVLVVEVVQYATYRAARIVACAGRDLREAAKFINVLEVWARGYECIEIEGWCRPAMVKLVQRLGWQPKISIVTWDLRRTLQ